MPVSWLWDLKKALSEGRIGEVDEALVKYFEGRLEVIEKYIEARFPHRAHLMRAAFDAHRREQYELSIPVFLAQIDGICKEDTEQYFFMRQNKKPKTAIFVNQIMEGTYREALLSPLAQPLPINASEDERRGCSDALNRHAVLHGESLDYGTKTNSLKAISLLNYVAQVLDLEKENPLRKRSGEATQVAHHQS